MDLRDSAKGRDVSGSDDSPQPDAIPEWDNEAREMHGMVPVRREAPPKIDSSDPAVIRAAQRKARLRARRIAATIGGMMDNPDVRMWMYRLLENCRAFAAHDFPAGVPLDALGLARNAAHREIGQFVTADIMAACPDSYMVMMKENA